MPSKLKLKQPLEQLMLVPKPDLKKHIPLTQVNTKSSSTNLSSKELVIERRKAMSTHGKSAVSSSDRTRTEVNRKILVSEVKVTADKNPDLRNLSNSETKSAKTKI